MDKLSPNQRPRGVCSILHGYAMRLGGGHVYWQVGTLSSTVTRCAHYLFDQSPHRVFGSETSLSKPDMVSGLPEFC